MTKSLYWYSRSGAWEKVYAVSGATLPGTMAVLEDDFMNGQWTRDTKGQLLWFPAGLAPVVPDPSSGVELATAQFTPLYHRGEIAAVIWRVPSLVEEWRP